MEYRPLGRTGINVSAHCLGSMTWGTQNTAAEAHAQIDYALDHGVNFIDTAEMYPTNPLSKQTQGDTERIIGLWTTKTGRRDEIILATKVSGKGYANVRGGAAISKASITEALHNSLVSLQTDYIDLYQLHWPNRGSYMFRQNWRFDPSDQDTAAVEADMLECLETLDGFIKEGKIRHIGLSNESAWGVMKWAGLATKHGLPRMASIQNEYSLLCRLFDTDLAEVTRHENVGLLAFSPLGTGLLTGKYQNDKTPEGSRKSLSQDLGGRITDRVWGAVDGYLDIAAKHGLNPTQMAMAFCASRPFMTSVIFGATSLEQLKVILDGQDLVLSEDVLADIDKAHRAHAMPF